MRQTKSIDMAITIEGPVKNFTVFERGNWNLKWTVSDMDFSSQYARNPTHLISSLHSITGRKQKCYTISKQILKDSTIVIPLYVQQFFQ